MTSNNERDRELAEMLQAVRDDVADDMLPLLDQMMVHLADEGWDRGMIGMFVMTVLIMDDELN